MNQEIHYLQTFYNQTIEFLANYSFQIIICS